MSRPRRLIAWLLGRIHAHDCDTCAAGLTVWIQVGDTYQHVPTQYRAHVQIERVA